MKYFVTNRSDGSGSRIFSLVNAMYLAKKRYERVKNEDRNKIYQKISQHLAYKGFNYDIIIWNT